MSGRALSGTILIRGVWRRQVPIPDGAQVWQINRHPPEMIAPDVFFQLHGLDHLRERHGPDYIRELDQLSQRVPRFYMTSRHPEIGGAQPYPVEMMRALYPVHFVDPGALEAEPVDYFTGSFAYAVALAITESPREIILDGVDFTLKDGDEMWAVPCLEFYLGVAVGNGIAVTVPRDCGVFGPGRWGRRYGYEGEGSR